MKHYTIYHRGKQIDTFVEANDASAVEWFGANYKTIASHFHHLFGDSLLHLYCTDNGAGRHVATLGWTGKITIV